MEPEKSTGGGLCFPGEDRVVYVPQERKSRLGLDVLANAKRGESQNDSGFKVPKERTISIAASAEDEDKSEASVVDEESSVTEDRYRDACGIRSTEHMGSDVPASPSGYDREDHRNERRHHRDDSRSGSRSVWHRDNYESKEPYSERDSCSRYGHEYSRKQSKYEGSSRTLARSDWDDGRCEWEDNPRRDSVSI